MNKKYGYTIPTFFVRQYLSVVLTFRVLYAQMTGRIFYMRDIPTWYVRFMGTSMYHLYKLDKRYKDGDAGLDVCKEANAEWLRRKPKLLKTITMKF